MKQLILAALANYESADHNSSVRQLSVWAGGVEAKPELPLDKSSAAPLAMADLDGDGMLDLFVGGRVLPGRYPEAASSHLFRGSADGFVLDADAEKALANIGLVSAAVFSDLDGDGFPELVLACEWDSLRVFRFHPGPMAEITAQLGLAGYKGWWNSVTTGDFNGDGKLDIVAGNWGRNSKYQFYARQPLRIYLGDLRQSGAIDVIDAHFEPELQSYVPWRSREALVQALPFLQERTPTAADFSTRSVSDLLGGESPEGGALGQTRPTRFLSVDTFDSSVFLNRGDHFERVSLPVEAQFAPVFGINVADLDGDGFEDIFLAQNFFGVDAETSRYDGGRGLCLRGDGHGNFSALTARESGVAVYGEQRSSALADFDHDGRVDLAVSQNGSVTKLYRNRQAAPGVAIRLAGANQNVSGVGALLRIIADGRYGPARELHAGSGYWSQDSAVQIMNVPRCRKAEVWVRWPGGHVTTSELPQNAHEISLKSSGELKMIR